MEMPSVAYEKFAVKQASIARKQFVYILGYYQDISASLTCRVRLLELQLI